MKFIGQSPVQNQEERTPTCNPTSHLDPIMRFETKQNDLLFTETLSCIFDEIKREVLSGESLLFLYSASFEASVVQLTKRLAANNHIVSFVFDEANLHGLKDWLQEHSDITRVLIYLDVPAFHLDSNLFEEPVWALAVGVFEVLKGFMDSFFTKNLLIDVYTFCSQNPKSNPPQSGMISGLLASLSKEMTHWRIKHMDVDTPLDLKAMESNFPGIRQSIFYHQGRHGIKELRPAICEDKGEFLQHGGTYLMLGAMDGIGQRLTQYLIEHLKAKIILVGPSALNEVDKAFVHAHEHWLEFIKADLTEEAHCDLLLKYLRFKYPSIDGVFDLEIKLGDASVESMTCERFEAILRDKLLSAWFIRRLQLSLHLKSAVIFSSMQSYDCLAGQTNYAAANCGLDAYADYLSTISGFKVKRINWGEVADELYLKKTGIQGFELLTPKEAWEAMLRGLNSQYAQFAVQKKAIGLSATKSSLDIAVVGMGGCFPQAQSINDLWQLLCDGRNAVSSLDKRGRISLRPPNYAGWLEDVFDFDLDYFHISQMEAIAMDPQQRLFLQTSACAILDAGYDPKELPDKSCGVFVGACQSNYLSHHQGEFLAQSFLGNAPSVIAGRVSHAFNLSGPALTIDTACSSSLVAIHQACQAIARGECTSALAGGVFLMMDDHFMQQAHVANRLSPDHACQTFSDKANGFVLGEAAACVYLKPLSQALKDEDDVYAIIKGSGINQDGQSNGMNAPSGLAQTQLMQTIYDRYGLSTADLAYVETHGTGTELGDPIEVHALAELFAQTSIQSFCALGSIKSNMGHSMHAAGVSGFIKLVLASFHQKIPASLHCERENPHIDFANTPFFPVKTMIPWPKDKSLGAVSSFGFSGTNAHVVIQSFPGAVRTKTKSPSFKKTTCYWQDASNVIQAKPDSNLMEEYFEVITL